MKSKLLKGLALLSFITLISVFLLYSAGYFDRRMEKMDTTPPTIVSTPTLENTNTSFNSTFTQTDTLPEERFSSLKSVVIPFDRLHPPEKPKIRRDSLLQQTQKRRMSSSKSLILIEQSALNIDSLIKALDSQKVEKKKQQ